MICILKAANGKNSVFQTFSLGKGAQIETNQSCPKDQTKESAENPKITEI